MTLKEIVQIKKLDESFLEINCSKDIGRAIWESFSFYAPNYKFSPLYKSLQWDGKIRLYNLNTKRFYIGLLPDLKKYLEHKNIEYELCFPQSKNNLDLSIYEKIKSKFINENWKVRDYQEKLFNFSVKNDRSISISPTGSGKSLNLYLLSLFYLLNKKTKILIVVPSLGLIEQMYNDFIEYATDTKINIPSFFHKMHGGIEEDESKPIYIVNWQNIKDNPVEWFEKFEVCIFDEAHTCKAKSLTYILDSCKNAKYRHGFTGTLTNKEEEVNQNLLRGLFGETCQEVRTHELIERNVLSDVQINCLRFKYTDEDVLEYIEKIRSENLPAQAYQLEEDYVCKLDIRNNFIKKIALSLNNNTIIFFKYVEKHGKVLYDLIEKDAKEHGKEVYIYYGKIKVAERERLRKLIETKNNIIIIASYGVASTGINMKNLHNAIFAGAYKGSIITLQTIGRGLRKHFSKEVFKIFDIGDDFTHNRKKEGRKNYLFKHFIERLSIYKEEKLNYKVYEYKISGDTIERNGSSKEEENKKSTN